MPYQTIALAGATGNLGPTIVRALVNANFTVTILSQSGKNTSSLPSQTKTIKVDYKSPEALTKALQGQQALISLIPKHNEQPALIDAAIAAGVKFFIPSEFGSDVAGSDKIAKLPVFAGKKATQEYLRTKAEEDKISYAIVVNGLFLDWGLQVGFWAGNLKGDGGETRVYDGGDERHSTTTLEDVGKAVVGILKRPGEFRNRVVYVQSGGVSQNQIIDIAEKRKAGLKIERVEVDTKELEKDAYEKLGKGDFSSMIDFIAVSAFRSEYGNDWSGKNDNELLGIREKSEEELEEIVARYL